MLSPWVLMNWLVQRRMILFENGEALSNIVTGALGLVPPIEGDWRALIPRPMENGLWPVLRWAAGEIASQPERYALSVL
jgi:hypothetical protein